MLKLFLGRELKCKNCKKLTHNGIWIAPQFPDEKVLLFCSDNCQNKYLKAKLRRIKVEYPQYYQKIKGALIKD